MHDSSIAGPLIVLGLLFFLGLLAIAAIGYFLLRGLRNSGGAQGSGTAGGIAAGLGGCAIAAALGCLGLLTLIAFLVITALVFSARAVDHMADRLPKRISISRSDTPPPPLPAEFDAERRARLYFTIEGDYGDLMRVEGLVSRYVDDDVSVEFQSDRTAAGEPLTRIVVTVEADARDIDEFERELREHLEGLDLGQGVVIEFEGKEGDF